MSEMSAKTHVGEASISAVVIRADGTREDLGVVSYWNKSWARRWWWRVRHGR
jgi:hypothetical protein